MLQHELVEKNERRNWSPRTTKNPDVNKASRVPDPILIPVSCIAIFHARYIIQSRSG
jgi:hypothetical protein